MRIAITGVGLVSALGATWSQSSEALLAGESGVGPVTLFDSGPFRTHIAAEAKLGPDRGLPEGIEGKRWSRTDRLGHAALHEALGMAGLDAAALRKERVMMSMGVGVSGLLRSEDFFRQTKRRGLHGANPNDILSHYPSATIDRLISQLLHFLLFEGRRF